MCSLDTAVIELIPINPFINDWKFVIALGNAENIKVKIKFPYSLFLSGVDRFLDIILDGGVEFRKRFLMRLRIPSASAFAHLDLRDASKKGDVFDTVTRDDCLPDRSEVFDENLNHDEVGTRLAIGERPNCS